MVEVLTIVAVILVVRLTRGCVSDVFFVAAQDMIR
jgi:hypothetical protein